MEMPAISSTASWNNFSLALDGLVNPLILRTNCRDAARTSSSVTGGSKLKRVLIFLHIELSLRDAGAFQKQIALARIARQGSSTLEFNARLGEAAELEEEIATNAGQEMVIFESRLRGESIDELQPGCGTARHGDGDRAIQFHDWRRRQLRELRIKTGDPLPVCLVGRERGGVAS